MLIETEESRRALERICACVVRMQPGQRLRIARRQFKDIVGHVHNGAAFTPPDRVLENIVGAAYTHDYRIDPATGDVIFSRYEDTGERHYVSPDRRGTSQ